MHANRNGPLASNPMQQRCRSCRKAVDAAGRATVDRTQSVTAIAPEPSEATGHGARGMNQSGTVAAW
jgi:hypothetical protein